jgi:hypothetical protein
MAPARSQKSERRTVVLHARLGQIAFHQTARDGMIWTWKLQWSGR